MFCSLDSSSVAQAITIKENAVNTLSLTALACSRIQATATTSTASIWSTPRARSPLMPPRSTTTAEDLVHLENNNTNVTLNVTGNSQFSLSNRRSAAPRTARSCSCQAAPRRSRHRFRTRRLPTSVSASALIGANQLNSNGTQNFTFSGNTINVSLPARGSGITVSGQELTTTNLTINDSTFTGAGGNGVISIDTNDSSRVEGTLSGQYDYQPAGHWDVHCRRRGGDQRHRRRRQHHYERRRRWDSSRQLRRSSASRPCSSRSRTT